jgi:hypothetical protein
MQREGTRLSEEDSGCDAAASRRQETVILRVFGNFIPVQRQFFPERFFSGEAAWALLRRACYSRRIGHDAPAVLGALLKFLTTLGKNPC